VRLGAGKADACRYLSPNCSGFVPDVYVCWISVLVDVVVSEIINNSNNDNNVTNYKAQ